MKNAIEYRKKNSEFMERYEKIIRSWLLENGTSTFFAQNVPFFRDGVVQPETWFDSKNTIRPLFIMKEVSLGTNVLSEVEINEAITNFNRTWNIDPITRSYFEFAENKFDDIQIGKFRTWQKVVRLAYGIFHCAEDDKDEYKTINLNAMPSDERSESAVCGYNQGAYKFRTGNQNYIDTVEKIAVLEIKKIGSGTAVDSIISQYGRPYLDHLKFAKEMIIEQIQLINPTVIVCCCGPDSVVIQNALLSSSITKDIIWINTKHHPGYSFESNVNFCKSAIEEYRSFVK